MALGSAIVPRGGALWYKLPAVARQLNNVLGRRYPAICGCVRDRAYVGNCFGPEQGASDVPLHCRSRSSSARRWWRPERIPLPPRIALAIRCRSRCWREAGVGRWLSPTLFGLPRRRAACDRYSATVRRCLARRRARLKRTTAWHYRRAPLLAYATYDSATGRPADGGQCGWRRM
jgi:hypothetical protein